MDERQTRSGTVWSEADDVDLRRRIAARQPVAVIAKGMGRRVDAIRGRAAALRIALPSSQRPWRQFPGRAPRAIAEERDDIASVDGNEEDR